MTARVRALVLAATLAATLASLGGCSVCPHVRQTIVVAKDDPELAGLIADCLNHVRSTNDPRCASGVAAGLDCACLPLCDRLYAIVVPGQPREALEECFAQSDFDDGGQEHVTIKYRAVCP